MKGLARADRNRPTPPAVGPGRSTACVPPPGGPAARQAALLVDHTDEATCALTGIRIINGGGRAEVQAAHIRPVKDQGPDSIRNGVALSGTAHWMFDRGLVSIGPPPDFVILAAGSLPDTVLRLLNPDRHLRVPKDQRFWPAPKYLDYHRTVVFKG